MTATDVGASLELQSQLYGLLGDRTSDPYGHEWQHGPLQLVVRAVCALPALRDVLAAAARDAETIKRVRALARSWRSTDQPLGMQLMGDDLHYALDGP